MKTLFAFVCLFFLPGIVIAFISSCIWLYSYDLVWLLLIGFIAGTVLFHTILKRMDGLMTFEHELTHALVAMLFLRRITRFISTRHNGGYVQHSGSFGGEFADHLIGLAPYYLPTFVLISAAINSLLPSSWFPWFTIWVGVVLAYHTFSNVDELKRNWNYDTFFLAGSTKLVLSDIGRRGKLFSLIVIITFLIFTHGLSFLLISKGYRGFVPWTKTIWSRSLVFYEPVFNTLNNLLHDGN